MVYILKIYGYDAEGYGSSVCVATSDVKDISNYVLDIEDCFLSQYSIEYWDRGKLVNEVNLNKIIKE